MIESVREQRHPTAKVERFVGYLRRLKSELSEAGKDRDAQTVNELIAHLGSGVSAEDASADLDNHPVYAVAAAYVTAQTMVSIDEAAAAQMVARKLVAHGYGLPKRGGDARGWKRLLLWRDQLARGRLPAELTAIHDRALKFAAHKPTDVDVAAALAHAAPGRCADDA